MKIIFRIADAIMEIYKQQNMYFVSTKLLLEALKTDYVNIIKYYEKPELAIKCIEYDISVLNSLIELNPEDPYSESYFSNYKDFEKFYEKILLGLILYQSGCLGLSILFLTDFGVPNFL